MRQWAGRPAFFAYYFGQGPFFLTFRFFKLEFLSAHFFILHVIAQGGRKLPSNIFT
jgi:hypothetical protein